MIRENRMNQYDLAALMILTMIMTNDDDTDKEATAINSGSASFSD